MGKDVFFVVFFVVFLSASVRAEEVVFKNGDRITGSILNDSRQSITVRSQALGTMVVDRDFIESPVFDDSGLVQQAEEKKAEWNRQVSLGYGRSGGNTVKSEVDGSLSIARKTEDDELTFRASAYYSSADKKMDAQKYYGMARYAFSFGEDLKWYNFYKLEADHDRFSNIDYRIIPAAGLGYWLSDIDNWKFMVELAGGLERTDYRDGKDSSAKFVAVPRGYLKRLLIKDLWFEQDIVFYVVADDLSRYRLRSESSLIHMLTEQLSWKFSLIDEYNSDPAGGIRENDYRLIYTIDYSF